MGRMVELSERESHKMSPGFWARKPVLWRRMGGDEKGQALPLVLAAVAMGTLLVVPFLTQASTTLLTSRDYGQVISRQYSADAGVEHAIWRLKHEPGFAGSLTPANPTVIYPITINNTSVNINVSRVQVVFPPNPPPPPEGSQAWRTEVSKDVDPNEWPANDPKTFTYAIYIKNVGSSTVHVTEIRDLLPAGFAYVAGSSGGGTTADPAIEFQGGQQKLRWTFSPPKPSINAGQIGTQTFKATATLRAGLYWNEAWVETEEEGIGTVGTGSTAPVRAGGMALYGYDILSNAGGTLIRARVTITDVGISILSWQVE